MKINFLYEIQNHRLFYPLVSLSSSNFQSNPSKKKYVIGICTQNDQIISKTSLRIKLKILTITIHSDLCEDE
jgi:hypothetical protein